MQAHVRETSARGKSLYGKFHIHNPPSFDGTTDPQAAESSINQIVRIFIVLRYSSEEWVDLAVHMLTGKAYQWWQITRSLLAAVRSITWECFHTAFYKQHFPVFSR